MSKARNQHIHTTPEKAKELREEYEMIGRHCTIEEPGHLIVFALTPRKSVPSRRPARKTEDEDVEKPTREQRQKGYGR